MFHGLYWRNIWELPTTKVSLEEYEDSTVPSKDDIEEETFQFDNDEEVSEQFYGNPSGFRLVLRRGQSDYANCAGDYKIALQTKVRGRPIYYNKGKQRIIFYNGSKYVITSYYYWKQVLIGGAIWVASIVHVTDTTVTILELLDLVSQILHYSPLMKICMVLGHFYSRLSQKQ